MAEEIEKPENLDESPEETNTDEQKQKWEYEDDYLSLLEKIVQSKNFDFKYHLESMVTQPMGHSNYEDKDAIIYEQFLKKEFNGLIPLKSVISFDFSGLVFLNENFEKLNFRYFYEKDFDFSGELSQHNHPQISCIVSYEGMMLRVSNNGLSMFYSDVSKYYKHRKELSGIVQKYKPIRVKKSRIHIVLANESGYYLSSYKVKENHINLKKNYNDDFIEVDNIIRKTLEQESKGVILLHGEMGSGKTFYIRDLVKHVDKKFIFIPSFLTNQLTETRFMTFLISQCRDSVLILEDSEKLLTSREEQKVITNVSDFLNMADGFMNDVLNIQFICTFNTKITNIDKALTRDGRLIAEYYFDKLTYEKSLECAKYLKKNLKEEKKYTLAEIYNYGKVIPRSTKKEKKISLT